MTFNLAILLNLSTIYKHKNTGEIVIVKGKDRYRYDLNPSYEIIEEDCTISEINQVLKNKNYEIK